MGNKNTFPTVIKAGADGGNWSEKKNHTNQTERTKGIPKIYLLPRPDLQNLLSNQTDSNCKKVEYQKKNYTTSILLKQSFFLA